MVLLGRQLDRRGECGGRRVDAHRPLRRLEPHLAHVRPRPLRLRVPERRVEDASATVAVGPREGEVGRVDALVLHVHRGGVEAHQHVRAAAVEVLDLVELLEEREALREMLRGLETAVLDLHDTVHLLPGVLVERAAEELDVGGPALHERRGRAVRPEETLAVVLDEGQERLLLLVVERQVAAGHEEDRVEVVEVLGVALGLLLGDEGHVGADGRFPEAGVPADLVERDERFGDRLVLPARRGAHGQQTLRTLGRLLCVGSRRLQHEGDRPRRRDRSRPLRRGSRKRTRRRGSSTKSACRSPSCPPVARAARPARCAGASRGRAVARAGSRLPGSPSRTAGTGCSSLRRSVRSRCT